MDRIAGLATGALAALPALLSVLPVYLLGLVAAWLLGVRGLLASIAAVPLLIGGGAALSELFHLVGLRASPLILVATLLALSGLTFVVRRLLGRRHSPAAPPNGDVQPDRRWTALGGSIGAAMGLGAWLSGIATTNLPPQGNDDIFHGYLVTRLLHTADLSAASVAPDFVGDSLPVSYYPYGIHLFTSMAASITSPGVPSAMNGTWVLLLGALLPLSTAVAARELFSARPRAALWAGILAPTTTGLYLLNGVMSYVMALSLVPAVVALAVRRIHRSQDVPWVVLALALMSLVVAHPAAAVSAAVVIACIVLGVMISRQHRILYVVISLAPPALGAAVLTLPSYLAAGSSGVSGQAPVNSQMDTLTAVSMAIRLATPWTPAQTMLGALVVLGAGAAFRWKIGRGLLVAYVLFLLAYVSVLSGYAPVASRTGLWYGQWYRLGGVVAVLAPLLGALGAELIVRGFRRFATPDRKLLVRTTATACLALTLAVVALSSARYVLRGHSIVGSAWGRTTVTDGDLALFMRARDVIGKDQVLNYWADGSTWMYAMAGLTPAIPYNTTVQHTAWAGQMLNAPTTIQLTPQLCRTMIERNIRFAIAKKTTNDGQPSQFYVDLATNTELFQQIERSDTVALYAVRSQTLENCNERN